jgi:hypothetical protein
MQVLMYKTCAVLEVDTLLCLWLGQYFCWVLRAYWVGLFRLDITVKMQFWNSLREVVVAYLRMVIRF